MRKGPQKANITIIMEGAGNGTCRPGQWKEPL